MIYTLDLHCIIQRLIDTVEDVLSHTSCQYLNNSLLIENWPDLHVSVIDLGGGRQNNESVPALYIFPLHSISPNEPPSRSSVSYSLPFFVYLSLPICSPDDTVVIAWHSTGKQFLQIKISHSSSEQWLLCVHGCKIGR